VHVLECVCAHVRVRGHVLECVRVRVRVRNECESAEDET